MTCPLPWQPYPKQTNTNVPVNINLHPASLARHPRQWSKEEVGVWLRWCSEEFAIEPVNPEKFDLNGKALCLLSRSDFLERLPKNGDVLYNCLQNLITKASNSSLLYQHNLSAATTSISESNHPYNDSVTTLPTLPRGVIFVPSAATCPTTLPYTHTGVPTRSYVPIKPYPTTTQENVTRVTSQITTSSTSVNQGVTEGDIKPQFPKLENPLDNNENSPSYKDYLRYPYPPIGRSTSSPFIEHKLDLTRHQRSSDCRLLWEFIYQLLMNTKYSNYVSWENKEEYVFRIVNPTGLAELWGQQKNRTNMTYEKLSRALRYYYRMNIIKKVQGKRLTYKFLQPPSCIQKGQRGAKPHGRVQVPYGEVSHQPLDPSLSDARVPDYDSDANTLSDPSVDGIEEDHTSNANDPITDTFGGESQTNSPIAKDKDSPVVDFKDLAMPGNRGQLDSSRFGLDSYYTDTCRLQLDRIPSVNPFHLTSSVYAAPHARYNLHYRGPDQNNVTTVYKPSPTYPVIGRNNLYDLSHSVVKQEQCETNLVPPAHSRNTAHPSHITSDNLKRSYSYDFSTLHVPHFPIRPHQARSASPYKDQQSEPEDLSLRKFDDLQSVDKVINTEKDSKTGEDENGNEDKDTDRYIDVDTEAETGISDDTVTQAFPK